MAGPMNKVMPGQKKVANSGVLFKRLMKYIMKNYTVHIIFVVLFIFISVIANIQGTLFTQKLIDDYITPLLLSDSPDYTPLLNAIIKVAIFYFIGALSTLAYSK